MYLPKCLAFTTYLPTTNYFLIRAKIWLIKMTSQMVHTLLVKKTILVTMDMLKLICPKWQNNLFDPCSNWVVLILDLLKWKTIFIVVCLKSKWPLTFDYCLYNNHAYIVYYIYIYKLYNFFYIGPNEKFNCWDLWLSNLGGKRAIPIMFQQAPFHFSRYNKFISKPTKWKYYVWV